MNSGKEMQEWCESFKTSKLWLTAIQSDKSGSTHTLKAYSKGLKTFCDWIEKNPDQLIAERKAEVKDEDTEMNAENKLREFCVVLEKSGRSKTTVVTKYHAVIKSFYSYNNIPLKLKTPKHATKEREPHTVDEIKTLLKNGDVRERAFIMLLKDSGISREDIITLKYGAIQNEYEANKEVIHIKVVRQKESIEYDTFIGKNAIESLKTYLEYRQRKGEHITKNTPLMATLSKRGRPMTEQNLSQIFMRLSEKVGFPTSPHRFRKFFESHMGLAAPSILVKYWMGHALGVEKSYFIPPLEKQREKYAEAYKEIDLFKTEISEINIEKRMLINRWMELKPDSDRKQLENLLLNVKTMEDLDEMRKKGIENVMRSYRKAEKDKDCANGNCQKIIEEQELSSYIEEGWKFVSVLPSGKIVVTNE